MRFIRERSDEETYREIRDALPRDLRTLLVRGVLPHAWVPFSLFVELNVEADRRLGIGDLSLCREMGRYGAMVTLPTLYRIFYRLGSLPFILRRASKLWDVHYDSGRMDVHTDEQGEALLSIVDFETPHRAHCLSVLGWAEAAAELSGVKMLEATERTCRTRGDTTCELFLRWRD